MIEITDKGRVNHGPSWAANAGPSTMVGFVIARAMGHMLADPESKPARRKKATDTDK